MTMPLPDIPPAPAIVRQIEPEWIDDLEDVDSPRHAEVVEAQRREPWVITNDFAAEGAMRRLRRLKRHEREIKDRAETWREPIDEWENDQLRRVAAPILFLEGRLEAYAMMARLEDPKVKTVRLPSGEIATRLPSAPAIKILDPEMVVAWAVSMLDDERVAQIVETKRSLRTRETKSALSVREVTDGWCRACGCELEFVDDQEPVHKDGEPADEHSPVVHVRYEAVYVLDDDELDDLPVPGTTVEMLEISAVVKPLK